MKAPLRLDPTGYVPLMPFAQPVGIAFPVFTSMQTWEDCLRYDPVGAMRALNDAIGRALASDRADYADISFKHWVPPQGLQRKARRVRMTATLYQMQESDSPWILLKPASALSRPGVFLDS